MAIHVIGAGLAGLAAAMRLVRRNDEVFVHEAATQAGGRCRSYHDPVLDMMIDNGNHLLLSANHAALSYLNESGAAAQLEGPPRAEFSFVDLSSGERWKLMINDGRLPVWILSKQRRVPDTQIADYLAFARLLWARQGKTICESVKCSGRLYERLARPLWLAALNTEPKEASARLAGAVMAETLAQGGKACRPLIASAGLAHAFVDPALAWLRQRNASIALGRRLRAFEFNQDRVAALEFTDGKVALNATDTVILAVPPIVAGSLVPGLETPTEFRAIVNAHFRIDPPPALPPITGVINGTIEWLFAFKHRLSVTISCADRLLDTARESLASRIWQEVAAVTGLPDSLPAWQIVRERRATFAATPAQNAKRPDARTGWKNLFLAGDWTKTGLPATIESAIRSGYRAADLVIAA